MWPPGPCLWPRHSRTRHAIKSASSDSPPAFQWEEWYAAVGGRSIRPAQVNAYLTQIRDEQCARFEGPVAPQRHLFASPKAAAEHLKQKAVEFGADIVGICEIEPSDVYQGRTITEKYAIAVGQRMLWRAFQVVPSDESAIECLRVYYTLGETVIALANHIRSLGYTCEVEHPIGDSNLLHLPVGLKAGFGELGRHGSIIPALGPVVSHGVAWRHPFPSKQTSPSMQALPRFATPAAPAVSIARQMPFLTNSVLKPGKTPSARTAILSIRANASPISPSTTPAPSACRCAFTTTKSGHATSRGFRRNCFPKSSCTTRRLPQTFPKRNGIATTSWDVNSFCCQKHSQFSPALVTFTAIVGENTSATISRE